MTTITTATFDDPCGYKNPTILKPRTNNTDLSYDYIMVKGSCSHFAPAIIDTDDALRWVGTAGISVGSFIFFDNAAYLGHGHQLSRIDLDGTVTLVGDYSSLGIVFFNHNIDRGKVGIILNVDTTTHFESVIIVTGKDPILRIGLVELYDLSPLPNSKLGNMSTRAVRSAPGITCSSAALSLGTWGARPSSYAPLVHRSLLMV